MADAPKKGGDKAAAKKGDAPKKGDGAKKGEAAKKVEAPPAEVKNINDLGMRLELLCR